MHVSRRAIRRAVCSVFVAAALSCAPRAPGEAFFVASTPFERLAARFIGESELRDPLFADTIGIHFYDNGLQDYSAHGHALRIRWLTAWRARLARTTLRSPDDDADAHALLDTIDLELFESATVRPLKTDPTLYTSVIGQAMYTLVGRRYASADERLRHAAARLQLIPGVVAAAQANLDRPARAATLQALDENAGNVALYRSLPAEAAHASPQTRAAIVRRLPSALASVRAFSTYLHDRLLPRSDGNPRVGARVYDRELRLANGTLQTREQLVADAEDDFARNRQEMLRLALPFDRRFFPEKAAAESAPDAVDVVVRRVLNRLAEDHPTRSAIFTTAKSDVAATVAFLHTKPVVVLPAPDTLAVVPTPGFMAGFSGASLDPAGPYTPLVASYYYIDEIPNSWSAARVASYLRDYNDYELKLLSLHEAVPGHYVQFRYNDRVRSVVRRVLPSGSFVEGWAVYTEGMMLDAGYGNDDPRLRLFQLKWRLREEADAIVDAEFHAGDLTQGQFDDLLERQAYQERSEVQTKWHRLQLSHVQLTWYFVGLDAIRRAEAAQRAKLGAAFDVAAFNASLLRMGSVEPRFIEPLLDREPSAR